MLGPHVIYSVTGFGGLSLLRRHALEQALALRLDALEMPAS
jgi:hypothetical protein